MTQPPSPPPSLSITQTPPLHPLPSLSSRPIRACHCCLVAPFTVRVAETVMLSIRYWSYLATVQCSWSTVLGTTSRVSQISKTIYPNVSSKTLPKASEASANWFEMSKLEQKCEQRLRALETCTQHSRQNKISSITVILKISFFRVLTEISYGICRCVTNSILWGRHGWSALKLFVYRQAFQWKLIKVSS